MRVRTVALGALWPSGPPDDPCRQRGHKAAGDNSGYKPVQPIAYSHALHAGELKLDCLFCHTGAEQSRHAGIPGGYLHEVP